MGVLEPTDAQIQRMVARAAAWDHAVADPTRMTLINSMAMDFYAARVDTGWAGAYLDDRLPGWRAHRHVRAGYAPASWTALVDHLGGRGVTDDELLETGLATRARTGNLIDRFRDRAILPITHEHQILGFVARRHPDLTDDDRCGPKYLNTADTVLFHKGAQLHGAIPELLQQRRSPRPGRRTHRRPRRHPRRPRPVRRRRPTGNRTHRRAGPPARHAEHPPDRRHRRRPARSSRGRTRLLAPCTTQRRPARRTPARRDRPRLRAPRPRPGCPSRPTRQRPPPRRDAHRRTARQPARQRRRPGSSQRHRSQPPDVLGRTGQHRSRAAPRPPSRPSQGTCGPPQPAGTAPPRR